jgi:hypothetical protein
MDYITWDILRGQLWEWITLPTISSQARYVKGVHYLDIFTARCVKKITLPTTSYHARCGNGLHYLRFLNKRDVGVDDIT